MARKSKHKKPKPPTIEITGDPTAPVVRVRAATWRHVLEATGKGLAEVIAGPDSTPSDTAGEYLPVELHRNHFDALLEAWVEELLHLGRQHNLVFRSFEILQLDLEADCKLTAMVQGWEVTPEQAASVAGVAKPGPRAQRRDQIECSVALRRAAPSL